MSATDDNGVGAAVGAPRSVFDRPTHLAGRVLLFSCIGICTVAVLYIVFVDLDIVAKAKGRAVPSGSISKTILARRNAPVLEANVVDGQHVTRGQVLFKLDCPAERESARVLEDRLRAERAYLSNAREVKDAIEGRQEIPSLTSQQHEDTSAAYWFTRYHQYQSHEAIQRSRLRANAVAVRAANDALEKGKQALQLSQARLAALEELFTQGHISKMALVAQQSESIAPARELLLLDADAQRLRIERQSLQTDIDQQRQLLVSEIEAAMFERSQLAGDIERQIAVASQAGEECMLTSPINGVFFGERPLLRGEQLRAGQVLATIAPPSSGFEMYSEMEDANIAFVRVGQPALIRFDALPFSRYGTFRGVVVAISPDTVVNGSSSIYKLRVRIDANRAHPSYALIRPGMLGEVDIVTGERSVISYLIGPVIESASRAMRER